MPVIVQVALGGAIGAAARYLSGAFMMRLLGNGFPYGTLFVNVVGSFLMGFLAFTFLERMDGSFARFAPFVLTGILGGFTTFSAFSLDLVYLLERGRYGAGVLYMGGSVLLSVSALYIGITLARNLS